MINGFVKSVLLAAIIGSAALFLSCGESKNPDSLSETVGPAGPTTSGFFFTLTVSPKVIQEGGSTVYTVRVWDATGSPPASSIFVTFAGSASTSPILTDTNGFASAVLSVTGGKGEVFYITATVEGVSLTIPVQILP